MAAPGYVNTLRSDGTVQMAAYGASCPFPWVLANVPKLNRHRPLSLAWGRGLRAPIRSLAERSRRAQSGDGTSYHSGKRKEQRAVTWQAAGR